MCFFVNSHPLDKLRYKKVTKMDLTPFQEAQGSKLMDYILTLSSKCKS